MYMVPGFSWLGPERACLGVVAARAKRMAAQKEVLNSDRPKFQATGPT